jgi:hypothetical protein
MAAKHDIDHVKLEDESLSALDNFSKRSTYIPEKSAANVSSSSTPYLNLIRARQSLHNTLTENIQPDGSLVLKDVTLILIFHPILIIFM